MFLVVVAMAMARQSQFDPEHRRLLEENRQFIIRMNGEIIATVGYQDLMDLQIEEFTTTMTTSISPPRQVKLVGVELRYVLEALEIDRSEAKRFVFLGHDGYISHVRPAEVDKPGVIYLCLSMDGKVLKNQQEGGFGPFLMVIRGAPFAQRWCKYVESIEIVS
jgi:DMSO/TMAO reductase YedYZ molybdopterin-dependent catalytic subunit